VAKCRDRGRASSEGLRLPRLHSYHDDNVPTERTNEMTMLDPNDAAEAALLALGESRSKHAGVISAFVRQVVRDALVRGGC
jgi:hypothetical protein